MCVCKTKNMDIEEPKLIRENEIQEPLPTEVIRPELNLERWPSIWQPSNSRAKPRVRVLKREVTLPDKSKVSAKVEVDYTSRGMLTTEDQKVYHALVYLWEQSERPAELNFSIRQLAKILGRTWGKDTGNYISQSLRRLQSTPLAWSNAYYNSNTGETIKQLTAFHILSTLQITEKEVDGHTTRQSCYVRFHELIEANLRNGYTKPLFPKAVFSFKSGIAQLLYVYLDLVMTDKKKFERRTKELFEDIGITGKVYRYPSARRRVLENALVELQSVSFPGGRLNLKVDLTNDKTDYKLVVEKAKGGLPDFVQPQLVEMGLVSNPSVGTSANVFHPEELVGYFLQVFRIGRQKPRPNELDEAAKLIAEFSLNQETGWHFVEFSKKAAQETNYHPKNFSGIVQYIERALPMSKPNSTLRQPQPSSEQGIESETSNLQYELESTQHFWTLAEELFLGLGTEEQERLIAEATAELKHSEKREVYARWSPETLREHICHQLKKELAEKYLEAERT